MPNPAGADGHGVSFGTVRRANESGDIISTMNAAQTKRRTLLERFRIAIAPRVSFNSKHFVPPILYHYTTAAGFHVILESKHLRATNFSFLNDPSEVQHGRELLEQTLVGRLNTTIPRHRLFFEFVISSFGDEMAAEVYVACFTKLEDDLSQWRAYGTAAGERYAIGFDSEAIAELATANTGASFHRVEYGRNDQQARIDDVLDRSLKFLDTHRVPPNRVATFADVAARRLARLMPVLKNPAYRREEEWRIVVWSTKAAQRPKFDTARGVVRPYMTFTLGNPPPVVALYVMAPTRREIALKAASMLLVGAGVDVAPEHSSIPFAE